MPFTLAHPAALLPAQFLPKEYLSISALVIGSMTPDFEYFFRMSLLSRHSHEFLGLFYYDVPVGFMLYVLFHMLVRPMIIKYSPCFFRARSSQYMHFNWVKEVREKFWIILASIFVGALSHLIWDGFTHSDGFVVEFFPVLRSIMEWNGYEIPLYTILNHMSTLVGSGLLLFWLYTYPARPALSTPNWSLFWLTAIMISALIFLINIYPEYSEVTLHKGVMIGVASYLFSLFITSFLFKLKPKERYIG